MKIQTIPALADSSTAEIYAFRESPFYRSGRAVTVSTPHSVRSICTPVYENKPPNHTVLFYSLALQFTALADVRLTAMLNLDSNHEP